MARQGARGQILVLSDSQDMQFVIRELLEDEGYGVDTGPYLTGDIETVASSSPDAIVIDCNRMELEESVTYLRAIRAFPHLGEIPIIASTSAVRIIDEFQSEVDEMGLRVLRKPFDIEVLATALNEQLADGRG